MYRFIGLGVGIGIGIEYYSHASIPTCPSGASERRGIPIPTATPIKANPNICEVIAKVVRIQESE